MSGEVACILNAGEAVKPQPVNKLPTAAFCAFKNIGTSSQGNCDSELIRAQTLAIGKASDQAAVWLFCAVSSRQWFQGLGVSSSAASASLQARSSQADCVSFCHGDESWSADQASVVLITHEAMWEREATCWWGPGRRSTTIGNMAKTDLRQNGGQDLHVGLAGMLVTSCFFHKSRYIFFPCLFLLRCWMPQVPLCTWSMGHYATDCRLACVFSHKHSNPAILFLLWIVLNRPFRWGIIHHPTYRTFPVQILASKNDVMHEWSYHKRYCWWFLV